MARQEFDFFISYSARDAAAAQRLETSLKEQGFKVWRDAAELRPGDDVTAEIPEALQRSEAVVVLWSPHSAASAWVRHEASWAAVSGRMTALALPGFTPTDLAPVYRHIHAADFEATLRDPAALAEKLNAIRARSAPPGPARVSTARLPAAANAFIGRSDEVEALRLAWGSPQLNITALIAAGGSGKTMLASAFLDEMARRDFAGAEAVFAYSFDSQGTDEKRQGSSDHFFIEALRFFGEDPSAEQSARDRAGRLAALLARRRTLLVLDGIEPLQTPRGDAEHGRLRDEAMADFLAEISRRNAGLCVLTTRMPLADLKGRAEDQVRQILLPNLPLSAGVAILRGFGLDYPQEQLEALALEYGQAAPSEDGRPCCHAKAIALVGGFIAEQKAARGFAPGAAEIAEAFAMPEEAFLGAPDSDLRGEPGYSTFKMMRRYEILFEDRVREQKKAPLATAPGRQLALLRLMGLFDRPAPWAALQSVLAEPAIAGLTEGLETVSEGEWRAAVTALRRDGLLNPATTDSEALEPGALLDAHPLVREYFARRLRLTAPQAYRDAHRRLYDFYRYRGLPAAFREPVAYALLADEAAFPEDGAMNTVRLLLSEGPDSEALVDTPSALRSTPRSALERAAELIGGPDWRAALAAFQPSDEAGMRPLFTAIAHGCATGLAHDCLHEVYWPRVSRGSDWFAVKKLGLHSSDLSALAGFFEKPFETPTTALAKDDQALLLSTAGLRLRAAGRLAEAEAPLRAACAAYLAMGEPEQSARAAANLSELLAALGRLRNPLGGAEISGGATDDRAATALSAALDALQAASSGEDAFTQIYAASVLAEAQLLTGEVAEAEASFALAESAQGALQLGQPLLYSLQGHRRISLALAQGRTAEALARAEYAAPLAERMDEPLSVGLGQLDLGRADLAAAQGLPRGERADALLGASRYFDTALESLRRAGARAFLPRAHLGRAACQLALGSTDLASADLSAARDIAERAGMRPMLADLHLAEARLRLEAPTPDLAAAERALGAAERLVAATGYAFLDADIRLTQADLDLARADRSAAARGLETLARQIEEQNLWRLLPEIGARAQLAGLEQIQPISDRLAEARAVFDVEADAAFNAARPSGTPALTTLSRARWEVGRIAKSDSGESAENGDANSAQPDTQGDANALSEQLGDALQARKPVAGSRADRLPNDKLKEAPGRSSRPGAKRESWLRRAFPWLKRSG